MPVSKTPVSATRPNPENSLAQQTFAFWEPEEDPCDRRGAVLSEAKTKKGAKTGLSTGGRTGDRAGAAVDFTPRGHSSRKRSSLVNSAVFAKSEAFVAAEALPTKGPGQCPVDSVVENSTEDSSSESSSSAAPLISRESLMADLRGRAAAISSSPAMDSAEQFSTGSPTVDSWLPGGGLKRGWICEWVAGHDASGASTLAMLAAASTIKPARDTERDVVSGAGAPKDVAFAHSGPIIVVDPTATFHASAAIACGISPQRIVVCRCRTRADAVWAMDQSLRCSSVAAVWATLPWNLNDRDARRLQLAAEAGRTPGLFVLQRSARVRPSFAAVRLHVASVAADASRLSADQRVAAGLPVRPPLDLRVLRVSLDRARGQRQNEAYLAITPNARLHTLSSAAVAHLQTPQRNIQTPAGSRHEAVAVPLVARLADPASTHRDRDAGTGRVATANTERRVG